MDDFDARFAVILNTMVVATGCRPSLEAHWGNIRRLADGLPNDQRNELLDEFIGMFFVHASVVSQPHAEKVSEGKAAKLKPRNDIIFKHAEPYAGGKLTKDKIAGRIAPGVNAELEKLGMERVATKNISFVIGKDKRFDQKTCLELDAILSDNRPRKC